MLSLWEDMLLVVNAGLCMCFKTIASNENFCGLFSPSFFDIGHHPIFFVSIVSLGKKIPVQRWKLKKNAQHISMCTWPLYILAIKTTCFISSAERRSFAQCSSSWTSEVLYRISTRLTSLASAKDSSWSASCYPTTFWIPILCTVQLDRLTFFRNEKYSVPLQLLHGVDQSWYVNLILLFVSTAFW